jgi:hypothetical protein
MTVTTPDFTGTHMFDRFVWASQALPRFVSDLRCVFEDPAQPDEAVRVLIPAPEWMACALAGGILPPIEVWHAMPLELTSDEGEKIICDFLAAQQVRLEKTITHEVLLPHHNLHAARPIGPLSEAGAMEYLIMKDVPFRVWGKSHNRPMFRIVNAAQLPASRAQRGAWRLQDIAA